MLSGLTNIDELWLYGNQLTFLPEWISDLTLSSIDVRTNHLNRATLGLSALEVLDNLESDWEDYQDLSDCYSVLDVPVSECLVLQDMFDVNTGTDLDNLLAAPSGWGEEFIEHMTDTSVCDWGGITCTDGHITTILFHDINLIALPESIGDLTYLHFLQLFRTQISSLPETIGELSQLQAIQINQNQVTSLPDSIGNLSSLTRLEFYDNQISSLPESIGNLTGLQILYLYDNQISSLPASIGNLINLDEFWIYGNQLTSLPASFSNLTNLHYLDIGDNLFTTLPDVLS